MWQIAELEKKTGFLPCVGHFSQILGPALSQLQAQKADDKKVSKQTKNKIWIVKHLFHRNKSL